MDGLTRLYLGDFNVMHDQNQPDGSHIITLIKDGDPKAYRFRVTDLYGKDEKMLEHEVIEATTPDYILERIEKAKEKQSKGG